MSTRKCSWTKDFELSLRKVFSTSFVLKLVEQNTSFIFLSVEGMLCDRTRCSGQLTVGLWCVGFATYRQRSYWPLYRSAWIRAHRRTPRSGTGPTSAHSASPAPRCRWIDCNATSRRQWWHLWRETNLLSAALAASICKNIENEWVSASQCASGRTPAPWSSSAAQKSNPWNIYEAYAKRFFFGSPASVLTLRNRNPSICSRILRSSHDLHDIFLYFFCYE